MTPTAAVNRRRGFARCALATAAVACALAAVGTGDARAATTISISSSDADGRITWGGVVVYSGKVAPAEAGRTVALEYRRVSGSYGTVGLTTTSSDGSWRITAEPRYTGYLRAVALAEEGSGEEDTISSRKSIYVSATLRGNGTDHLLRCNTHSVTGSLGPGRSNREVLLERLKDGAWQLVGRGSTNRDGSFRASWRPCGTGTFPLRVRFEGDSLNEAATAGVPGGINVYRESHASWYGPGFYGNRTACGQTYTPTIRGVAHKTLPCGTMVSFYYHGRTTRVPVIDRGPYIAGRDWDFSNQTKNDLGFSGVDTVWSTR